MAHTAARRLLALLCLAVAAPAAALNPDRDFFQYEFSLTPEHLDLPSEVLAVQEDRQGFLWLATRRGLMKYDGIEATSFRVSEYPNLLSNRPTALFIDSANRLFIASDRGTALYSGGEFQVLLSGNSRATEARAFAEGPDGGVWLGTEEGLWHFDGSQIEQLDREPFPDHIQSLLWHADKLYIGSRGSVLVLEGDELSVIELPERFERAHVRDLEFHQGHIWGATRSGLFRLDKEVVVTIEREALDGLPVDVLLSDRDENLWFASRSVVGRFYPDGRLELPNVRDERLGYAPEVADIYEDSLGRHWHGSRFFGLGMLVDTPVKRVSYTEGLPSTNVLAVAVSSAGQLYVATDQGVSAVTGTTVTEVVNDDFSPGNAIQALHVDSDSRLWLGTESHLRHYSESSGGWSENDGRIDLQASVNSIVPGADGELWVGTDAGLFRVRENDVDSFPQSGDWSIQSLLYDSQGELWLGTDSGVARLVDDRIVVDTTELPSPTGTVVSLRERPSGGIVAATADHGLLVRNGERWMRYGEEHGLPPEQIIDIHTRAQHTWLVTGAGLFRTALPDQADSAEATLDVRPIATIGRYGAAYTTNCCRGNNGSSSLLVNDELIAGTDDGIVLLDVEVPASAGATPRPYLKAIWNAGTRYSSEEVNELVIGADDSDVRIDYSAVQLENGDQVRFRYRLLGLNGDWVEAGSDRSARFLGLPPGNYTFELQASSYPNNWSPSTTGFTFHRQSAFAETLVFRAVLWATAVAVGLLLIAAWLAVARRRHRALEARIQARTTELDKVNNELRVANESLQHSTQTDPLTGLVNRRYFNRAQELSELNNRVPETGLLVMLDIDFFKRVNDAYGHSAGDEVLCQFADLLQSTTREADLVARWGGEEFVMVCYCPQGFERDLLSRVCEAIRGHSFTLGDGRRLSLTCSVGAIRYPLWPNDAFDRRFAELLEIADAALYAVKMNGRDGWAMLESDLTAPTTNLDAVLRPGQAIQKLQKLIDDQALTWAASRSDIDLSLADTITRLRALKAVPK